MFSFILWKVAGSIQRRRTFQKCASLYLIRKRHPVGSLVALKRENLFSEKRSSFHFQHYVYVRLYFSNLNSSNLSGTPPECFHEYLDLFTEVRKPEDKSLIETPFGGRYCGKIPPRLRISLYNSLSFVFHSDRPNITTERFSGTFQFIPEGKFTFIDYTR